MIELLSEMAPLLVLTGVNTLFGAVCYAWGRFDGRRVAIVRVVIDNRADAEVNMTWERARG